MFTIDADYNVTSHNGPAAPREDAISFSTQKGFGAATANWTTAQFVDLWNSFAGAPPFGNLRQVTKFMDRNTAIKRIWNALQDFPAPAEAPAPPEFTPPPVEVTITTEVKEEMPKPAQKKTTKAPRKASVRAPGIAAASGKVTRKETVLALIGRKHGATLAEIMEATGWQAHSVRGMIATLGTKHGCKISSTRNEANERTYQGA